MSPCHGIPLVAKIGTDIQVCEQCNTEFQLIQIQKDWEKIRGRYPGKCIVCRYDLHQDEVILWKRGTGIKHLMCEYPRNNLEAWL